MPSTTSVIASFYRPRRKSTDRSLSDDEGGEFADINGHNAISEFRDSMRSCEDSIALSVGLSVHEYMEECFYMEVSVLEKDKFDAIPEIVKADFTITGHLGKGSFSDVFEVVCKDSQFISRTSKAFSCDTQSNDALDGTPSPPAHRRPARGMRPSLSSSINIGILGRPQPNTESKHIFAMKCLRPQIRSDIDQFTIGAEDLVHETAILATLNHRHIIKLHGRASGSLTNAFLLNDGYFILLDRLTGTLNEKIDSWKHSPKYTLLGPTAKQIEVIRSVADAMSYLHSKNIIFRDLKPDNVGFDSMGVPKLFDFGFAIGLPEKDGSNPAGLLFERCGTPRYMAPEVALSRGYGLSSDVYSIGVLLWEVCALTKPFSSFSSAGEFEREVFLGGKRPALKNHWSTSVKELISSCWSATPCQRPTMQDVKSTLSMELADITGEKKSAMRHARSRMTRRRSDW